MSSKIVKVCTRCTIETMHRMSTGYPVCSVCSEQASKRHRKNHWYKYLAQKANARKRQSSVHLTEGDVIRAAERSSYRCAISGWPLDVESEWYKPSLDRIDSNKGYTPENIQVVAWIVNHCKLDLSSKEFINMCVKVANNNSYAPYLMCNDPL